MTVTELQNLSDDDLVSLYEQHRSRPLDLETRKILRALERRALRCGGQVLHSESGVRYCWDEVQETVTRSVFNKEHARATSRALGRSVELAVSLRNSRSERSRRGRRGR